VITLLLISRAYSFSSPRHFLNKRTTTRKHASIY
jgi:hypothetical protein